MQNIVSSSNDFAKINALLGRLFAKKFLLLCFASVIVKVYRSFSIDGRYTGGGGHVFSHVSNLIAIDYFSYSK